MTKQILITGMNKLQCTRNFHLNQQLKVVSSQYSLMNCLRDIGYNVVQREVEIGESLDDFDDVIVYFAGPRQLVTTKLFNGLWAIHKKPDCILANDDWQIADLFKGFQKHSTLESLSAEFILNTNRVEKQLIDVNIDQFLESVNVINSMKNRMLVSAFSTKHLSDKYGLGLLFDSIKYPKELLFQYNPNPYHRNRKPGDYDHIGKEDVDHKEKFKFFDDDIIRPEKRRNFNFASLVQSKTKTWLKKQGFKPSMLDDESGKIGNWFVDLYGSKADAQKRLTEDEMCKIYDVDWACLMPGYQHSGSGWWRARPLQVADADSILIGDKKELDVYYGDDFQYNDLKAKDIIDLSDIELKNIALKQKEAIYKIHPLDKNVQQQEILKCLENK